VVDAREEEREILVSDNGMTVRRLCPKTSSRYHIRREKAKERKEILSRRAKDRILLCCRKHVQGFIYACIQCNCTNGQNRNR